MDTAKTIRYWLEGAADALRITGHLFEKEDYHYALFFGHLALEKLLKALVVQTTKQHAQYTHNLIKLAKTASLFLTEEDSAFLKKATEFNLETRYPEDIEQLRKLYTREFSAKAVQGIKELYTLWHQKLQS